MEDGWGDDGGWLDGGVLVVHQLEDCRSGHPFLETNGWKDRGSGWRMDELMEGWMNGWKNG